MHAAPVAPCSSRKRSSKGIARRFGALSVLTWLPNWGSCETAGSRRGPCAEGTDILGLHEKQFRRAFLALLFVLAACSPQDTQYVPIPSQLRDLPSNGTATLPAEPADTTPKVTPPVEIALTVEDASALAQGQPAVFHLEISPDVAVARLEARFTHTGALRPESPTESEFGAAAKGATRTASLRVRSTGQGKAEVRAWASGFDEQGDALFNVSRAVYLLVGDDYVLTGDKGFLALQLEELDLLLERGDISQDEYATRRRRVRTGGASEQITVSTPDSATP